MEIKGSKVLVIGGAGLIGSHVVEQILKEDIKEVIVYDNFCRGTHANLQKALQDPRCRIFEIGGDILQTDILDSAMQDVDGVVHLAALWLLRRAKAREIVRLVVDPAAGTKVSGDAFLDARS